MFTMFPNRKRRRAGFTLSETLAAVLIMTLMSGAMAVGVNFAVREYRHAVLLSEGRMLSGSVSDIIRNELYTNSRIMIDGDEVSFYNGDKQDTQRFALSDGSVEGIPKGRLCMRLMKKDEWMPLLGSSAYASRALKLDALEVKYEDDPTVADFGCGSFHIVFDVVETQTNTTVLHNDFYAMALNDDSGDD